MAGGGRPARAAGGEGRIHPRFGLMTHYSRLSVIVIDTSPADHDQELAFWQAATGVSLAPHPRFPE